jgi:hemolysin III
MASARPVAVGLETVAPTTIRASGVKPALRGVPDVIATVIAVPAAALLIAYALPGLARVSAVIYGIGLVLLFATSATYHTPMWPMPVRRVLRRLDHSAIYVLIAGCYTPPCLLILPAPKRGYNNRLLFTRSQALPDHAP